jgi:glutaredoxin
MSSWTVIGTKGCSWCVLATDFLYDRGEDYTYIDLTSEPTHVKLLYFQAGFKTVPQIFHEGMYVGGYEDLEKYYEQ